MQLQKADIVIYFILIVVQPTTSVIQKNITVTLKSKNKSSLFQAVQQLLKVLAR
jgi:hypothetical protein